MASARSSSFARVRRNGGSIHDGSATSASPPVRAWAGRSSLRRVPAIPLADPIDRVSSRPDYLALVYGAGRARPGESLNTFPPTFLVSAAADLGPSIGNAQLFLELTKAGAVAEIHVYQKGRHGFGSGLGSPEFAEWMRALEHFLIIGGFLEAGS